MSKKALIIQGGGFRTGFSAGVLDAFIEKEYNPFDIYAGVSGGAIAASYFLQQEKRKCLEAMFCLTDNSRFINYRNLVRSKPVMDVDFFREISSDLVPLDISKVIANSKDKKIGIVMTNANNGNPHYHEPTQETWIDALIASSSMPLVTKGAHRIGDDDFMDGAWSDSLPVKWAVEQGATDILIIRTTAEKEKMQQSWLDYFGELYNWRQKDIKRIFQTNHIKFNQSLEFILNPPAGIRIQQIAPDKKLHAQQHSNSSELITKDHAFGYEKGLAFLEGMKI
jgi:predicted patatin/cPLA2 family phospholipase